jgi:hypothetical protein
MQKTCTVCKGSNIYRLKRCRKCYKIYRLSVFHCTYKNCCKPVFAATLCQYHYRHWRIKCLMCDRNVYCKTLCRRHYRACTRLNSFPEERKCRKCNNNEYVDSLCLSHFKEKYKQTCLIVGCDKKSHKRGLCCSHYFKERRKM